MRNFDLKILSPRFDCCIFLFYRSSAATFSTASVRSGGEGRICAKSAYLSGADPNQCRCDVRTVPQPDISSRRLSACGYARLCPIDSESQNAMQQVRISETVMPSCCRELLALRDFGI